MRGSGYAVKKRQREYMKIADSDHRNPERVTRNLRILNSKNPEPLNPEP